MNWPILSVELAASAWILIMLIADLLPAVRKTSLWILAMTGVVVCAALLGWESPKWIGQTFQGMFAIDRFAIYFKGLFLLTTAVVIVMTRKFGRHLPSNLGAFYMLLFTALLGMLVIASAQDLLLLFIGLELLTFSLYIMAAYLKTDARAIEAGMKYLILGSVSGGFVVYGIALLYGATGGTGFAVLSEALFFPVRAVPWTAQVGLLLILAGLGFKVGMVPFHLWVPDVYEGAPTPVVALLSVGSKMAGIVAMIRLLYGPFAPLYGLWGPAVAVLAAATMLYGNLAAIPQTNIKRLLGYSSIGHAGYLLMGLSTAGAARGGVGLEAVGFYLLAYAFSNLAVFLVVVSASDAVGGDSLDAYNGLSKRSPLLAAILFLGLLSLAGVPPLAGFVGKLFVLLVATEAGQLWLVAIGAGNVAISLYYYLMIVRRAYLLEPASRRPIAVDRLTRVVLLVIAAGIILIGVFQGPFLAVVPR